MLSFRSCTYISYIGTRNCLENFFFSLVAFVQIQNKNSRFVRPPHLSPFQISWWLLSVRRHQHQRQCHFICIGVFFFHFHHLIDSMKELSFALCYFSSLGVLTVVRAGAAAAAAFVFQHCRMTSASLHWNSNFVAREPRVYCCCFNGSSSSVFVVFFFCPSLRQQSTL